MIETPQPPERNENKEEKKFLEYGQRVLNVLRKIRGLIHQETQDNYQAQDLLAQATEFAQAVAVEMVSMINNPSFDPKNIERIFQSKEDSLSGKQEYTVVNKQDRLVALALLDVIYFQIQMEKQLDLRDEGKKLPFDFAIEAVFNKQNNIPIRAVDDIKEKLTPETVVIAPLSAGLLLVSVISEYLKRRTIGSVSLPYSTASTAKKVIDTTFVPDGLEDFNTFWIVDETIDDAFAGTEEEMYITQIQVEKALKQKYGPSIRVRRGENFDRNLS